MSGFQNPNKIRGDHNRGGKGLFSDDQIEDRLKVHAIAMANGNHPTTREICQLWKEKYGITIAEQSERAWRVSNADRIRRKRIELINSGEIDVPVVSNREIADNVQTLLSAVGKHRSVLENSVLYQKQRIENMAEGNKYEQIGITPETYFHASEEAKREFDFKLSLLSEQKNEAIKLYQLFDESLNAKEDKAVKMLDMLVKQAIKLGSDETKGIRPNGSLPKTRHDLPKDPIYEIDVEDITDEMRESLE